MSKKTTDENIVTLIASLPDGTFVVEHPDGRLERRKSETNWERLRTLTDDEINASIAGDPDWEEEGWSEAVIIVPPKKQPISIRIDGDVLDFFKKQGAGYQKRINAVLRSFMNASRKGKKRA